MADLGVNLKIEITANCPKCTEPFTILGAALPRNTDKTPPSVSIPGVDKVTVNEIPPPSEPLVKRSKKKREAWNKGIDTLKPPEPNKLCEFCKKPRPEGSYFRTCVSCSKKACRNCWIDDGEETCHDCRATEKE